MKKIPETSVINLALQFGILKRTVRTGWKKKFVKDPESVAEHSYRLSILAMLLAPYLSFDQNKLLKMALIHDLGESKVGDIIWEQGKKVIGSQKDKHHVERLAVQEIFKDSPEFSEYLDLLKEFEKQETRDAQLLKQMEKIEMVMQTLEYEREGFSKELLAEHWENAEKYLKGKELEPLLKALQKLRIKD